MERFLSLSIVFLLAGAAQAQDGIIKNYSPTDFEKFVKDDLKKKLTKIDNEKYDIEGSPYFVAIGPKVLIVYATDEGKAFVLNQKVTLEKLNAWNTKAVYSRAYLLNTGEYRFEGTLDFSAGISREQVMAFYTNLNEEFVKFIMDFGGRKQ
jgi:Putative bacterial sensory transduction regulator